MREEAVMQELIRREVEEELTANTVKKLCLYCGRPLPEQTRGRPKKFCSDECRYKWKWKHPNVENWASARKMICPQCGKEFLVGGVHSQERKYCSHACANKARARREEKSETNN